MMDLLNNRNFFVEMITFCEVIEAGNFTKAAKKLGIHHSTITRRIQNLEDGLGIKLLLRNQHQFTITESGHMLYHSFLQQKEYMQNTIHSIQSNQNRPSGKFRIAVPTVVSHEIISPYLALFLKNNPSVTLEVFYINQEFDFISEFYDLVIVNYIPVQKSIKIKKLITLHFGFYCSPEYIKKYGFPTEIDSNDHFFLGGIKDDLTVYDAFPLRNLVSGEMAPCRYGSRLYYNNLLHTLPLISSGEAIGYAIDSSVKEMITNGKLVQVMPEYRLELNYYLIRLYSGDNPAFTKLVKFLQECFQHYKERQD